MDKLSGSLNQAEISQLVAGRHSDVFAVLGMHQHPTGEGLIVRALLPAAISVELLEGHNHKVVANLIQLDSAGLFEGEIPEIHHPFYYRLRIQYANHSMDIDDPYAFPSLLREEDLYLFCEGSNEKTYQWMGAHPHTVNHITGMSFVLWAPEALRVSVVGDFNCWNGCSHLMRNHPGAGVWEIFIPGIMPGASYKYEIVANTGQVLPLKSDPYAFAAQKPPKSASITVAESQYDWCDENWMVERSKGNQYNTPISIYEVHLGSWRRSDAAAEKPQTDQRYLTYHELAEELIPYVVEMGFTHIQLMPVSEFPFDGSWGYQPIGLFAPTSRFGSPEDFKYFVDCCHRVDIGLLLDWVPGHFPTDEHGTGNFDGSFLYEHADVRKGFHPDWNTLIYNYGRNEVISYLLSNAMFWFDQYHIDGMRFDAVASMLYLDYSREEGEWVPNIHGGRENLEAIALLKQINSRVYFNHPGVMMVAEESTAWPGVSRPVDQNGLGFGFKWNMGWMNDTLQYMVRDPIYRQHHHDEMTFGLVYSFSENFVLPLSHDEVVHGKGSLINKMPGDDWQKFANLRAYFGFMWTHPGKKLLFMGGEFAQKNEWNHDISLDWHLLAYENHRGIQRLVKDLNRVYRSTPALYELDCDSNGFEWLVGDNASQSIFIYLRKGFNDTPPVVVVVNMTPTPYSDYCIGVPQAGVYNERLNTDSSEYGGSNVGNAGGVSTTIQACNGQAYQLTLAIPPLATLIFEWQAN